MGINSVETILFVIVIGYFAGSIPTGWIITKFYGLNILALGSKSVGGTNVFRLLGRKAGVFVFFFDTAKGALIAGIWRVLAFPDQLNLGLTGSFFAIIGHVVSIPLWLLAGRLRGGRGVATALGAFYMLMPWTVSFIATLSFILCFIITRFLPFSVLLGISTALIVNVYLFLSNLITFEQLIFTALSVCIIYLTHHPHLVKLIQGKSEKFDFSQQPLISGNSKERKNDENTNIHSQD